LEGACVLRCRLTPLPPGMLMPAAEVPDRAGSVAANCHPA